MLKTFATLALTIFVVSPTFATPLYQVQLIPIPDPAPDISNFQYNTSAINTSHQICINTRYTTGQDFPKDIDTPYLYQDHQYTQLSIPKELGNSGHVYALNSSGSAVGSIWTSNTINQINPSSYPIL